MNHQFVESLIALRNRYQSLLEEMEHAIALAKQQLVHVNALLLDRIVDNEGFVTSLMELGNRYQTIAHQSASKASHASSQIAHVNALLADQLVWQHEPLPVSIQASPLNENSNRSLRATADIDSDEFPNQTDAVDEIDAIDELAPVDGLGKGEAEESDALEQDPLPELEQDLAEDADARVQDALQELEQDLAEESDASTQNSLPELEQDLAEDADPSVQDSLPELALDETNSPGSAIEESATAMVQPDLKTVDELESPTTTDLDSEDRVHTQPGTRPFPPLKTPMLPQFQQGTKFQAVEGILQQKAGSILHIDYIIRALHGNLPEDDVLAEKGRMSQTLSDGAKRGLWQKVQGEPGCYTFDLKLIDPDKAIKASVQKQGDKRKKPPSKNNSSLEMLPAYSHLSLIDAVDLCVNENAGQIVNTDLAAQALYGELSGLLLRKAKEIVGRALWRGAEAKRWQRVPGQGQYTLSLRLLKPETRKT